ncbi:Ribosome-binding ATPase YchF [uncultured archaeon]|nr:Ribosome-binding ATPase YchF [uncultured archaeon]
MLVGIIGAPNKGKSLLFSCLTSIEVPSADYPFTTIEPNRGVALLRVKCAHVEMGLPKCDARGGHCKDGMREIAVPLLDVAGLVPGASEGRGKGNQFLDDLRTADGFIHVVDASGRTDLDGQAAQDFPLDEEVGFLQGELAGWLAGILKRNEAKYKNRGLAELMEAISGLGYTSSQITVAAQKAGIPLERIQWTDEQTAQFAKNLWADGKPMLVAANKADLGGAMERVKETQKSIPKISIRPCSAMYEHVLQKAGKAGMVKYTSGAADFEISGTADGPQKAALERIRAFMKENGGTGVQAALHELVFEKLGMLVVYPVEDENHCTDRKGLVLPDAFLVPAGTTAVQMAAAVHTDLAKSFIGAVDAKTKRRVGKDHVLKFGDIIKIVAAR